MKPCANCNGSGQVAQAVSDSQTLHKCSFCDGEGAFWDPVAPATRHPARRRRPQ